MHKHLINLCPKFLHTNSTSHTWPFSAVAELIDNAYDPDVNAKQIWIDKTLIRHNMCMTFTDNGSGMSLDKLHKMLSFGFSDKVTVNGHVPVGLYGNGFKSGSMRLGKDALVFTKKETVFCIGMLSQTYLEAIKAEHVVVPIITFNKHRQLNKNAGSQANLNAILKHSMFTTERELLAELDAIIGKKGTRIIIWNLKRDKHGKPEFDFNKDKYDIRIPDDLDDSSGKSGYKKQDRLDQIPPESDYSLRAYCSILYLKPRMQIVIRGQKVQTRLVSKDLAYIERDIYRPKFLAPKTVKITFGFNCRNEDHYGVMMYHKNRLIKAYERVGCQLKANNMGVGVVGVIECNFLKPTHNKQDFDYTNEYRLTMAALGEKLNDYWNEMKHKRNFENPQMLLVEEIQKRPDQSWVQCDSCLHWRKLPDGMEQLPEKWYCHMNPDPEFRDCSVPEEPEDDDLIDQPSYEKTFKKKDKEKLKTLRLEHMEHMEHLEQIKQMEQLEHMKQMEKLEQIKQMEKLEEIKQLQEQQESLANFSLDWLNPTPSIDLPACPSPIGRDSFPLTGTSPALTTFISRSGNTSNHSGPASLALTNSSPDNYNNKRPLSGTLTPVSAKKSKTNESEVVSVIDLEDNDDGDVIIVENNSTPKPSENCDISKVKSEHVTVELDSIPMDTLNDCKSTGTATATTECEQLTISTQTDSKPVFVKKEEFNDEDEKLALDEKPSALEITKDNSKCGGDLESKIFGLKSLLRLADQEKECYLQKCRVLTKQVKKLEEQIAEMNEKVVKKEDTGDGVVIHNIDGISSMSQEQLFALYEKALKEADKFKEQCETLQSVKDECRKCAARAKLNTNSELDEMAEQLDNVFRQLDTCSIEKEQFKHEVQLMEVEKSQILQNCEQLKTEVEQLKCIAREMSEKKCGTSSMVEDAENRSLPDSLKLRSLRLNIGHLLATIMPELDLQEINGDVDLIDEILGQVVDQMRETST
ncbi:MORC family CW-type zinc finger protein 3 isoform X2 [Ambystoma mexicanum]|uniref:MORC family CW-type zinc finger protein 3 isoform X2 n=1 Tax=Ambystoma mexicanum TaxID=8296 RepID=UPI0037E88FF9